MSQVIGNSNGQVAQPINLWATVKVSPLFNILSLSCVTELLQSLRFNDYITLNLLYRIYQFWWNRQSCTNNLV